MRLFPFSNFLHNHTTFINMIRVGRSIKRVAKRAAKAAQKRRKRGTKTAYFETHFETFSCTIEDEVAYCIHTAQLTDDYVKL